MLENELSVMIDRAIANDTEEALQKEQFKASLILLNQQLNKTYSLDQIERSWLRWKQERGLSPREEGELKLFRER